MNLAGDDHDRWCSKTHLESRNKNSTGRGYITFTFPVRSLMGTPFSTTTLNNSIFVYFRKSSVMLFKILTNNITVPITFV